jgi:serine/threonine protein kinase
MNASNTPIDKSNAGRSKRLDIFTLDAIKRNLDQLKLPSLYTFLGLPPESSAESLRNQANEINKDILKIGKTDTDSLAKKQLCGLCLAVFRDTTEKEKYDNYQARLGMERLSPHIEIAGGDGVISQEEMGKLIELAKDAGVKKQNALDYIKEYARKRKWLIEDQQTSKPKKQEVNPLSVPEPSSQKEVPQYKGSLLSKSEPSRQRDDRLEKGSLLQNGRYEILRHLRTGGQANVYEAKHCRLKKRVVIKETRSDEQWMHDTVEKEGAMLASLNHKALPTVYDCFSENNRAYLVMEFIEGDDLDAFLRNRGGPFAVEDVLDWGMQLLDVVEFLHNQPTGIIHRDINPRNIKLNGRQIVLLDFGIAKLMSAETPLIGGSPHYASPEQLKDEGTDTRSDLYSLAATLYHLLTYIPPPDALTRQALVLKSRPDPLRSASEYNNSAPTRISQILLQAMSLDPDDRPQSVGIMRRLLADAISLSAREDNQAPENATLLQEAIGAALDTQKALSNITKEQTSSQGALENKQTAIPRSSQIVISVQPKDRGIHSKQDSGGLAWTTENRVKTRSTNKPDDIRTRVQTQIAQFKKSEFNILLAMGITGTLGFVFGWLSFGDGVSQSVARMLPPALLTRFMVLSVSIIYAIGMFILVRAFYRLRTRSIVTLSWGTFGGFLLGCIAAFILMTLPIIIK